MIGGKEAGRTKATVGGELDLAGQGVQMFRVRDVRPIREALVALDATGGLNA